jgi:Domain of unknown function (DUF6458)
VHPMTIAAGIFLIAVGAILRYATNFDIQDVEMDTVGLILMIAGAAGLVLSFFQEAIWAKRRDRVVEEPVERERVVERPPADRRY